MPVTVENNTVADSTVMNDYSKALSKEAKEVIAKYTDDELKLAKSASASIQFLNTIGDANRKSKEDGSPYTIGYRFKNVGSAPIEVPILPYTIGKNIQMADFANVTTKSVAAGEEFILNKPETGYLMSQIEYSGQFTGGGKTVDLAIKCTKSKEPFFTVQLNGDDIYVGVQLLSSEEDCGAGYESIKPYFRTTRRISAQVKDAKLTDKSAIAAKKYQLAIQKLVAKKATTPDAE